MLAIKLISGSLQRASGTNGILLYYPLAQGTKVHGGFPRPFLLRLSPWSLNSHIPGHLGQGAAGGLQVIPSGKLQATPISQALSAKEMLKCPQAGSPESPPLASPQPVGAGRGRAEAELLGEERAVTAGTCSFLSNKGVGIVRLEGR